MFRFMPDQASSFADKVDSVNHLITDISLFFTVAIVGAMIYFAIKYRARPENKETPHIEGNIILEIIWTLVPTVICIIVAVYGVMIYREMRDVPKDAMTISVWGQKWKWDFEYENGKKTVGEFVVPVNKPVKLVMKSRDVLHSFFVPAMRVKNDVIPSQYSYLWFQPIKTGTYTTFCTEYCGREHSQMMAKLRVVSQAEFDRWLADRSEELMKSMMPREELGKKLYNEKGCVACHSLDGTPRVGPSFLKLYGKQGKTTDGVAYTADEAYIQESIYDPNKKIVEGYPPNQMPNFTGQLNDDDMASMVAFIKTLDGSAPVEAAAPAAAAAENLTPVQLGEKLYQEKACFSCHSLDGSRLIGPSFKGLYGRSGELESGESYVANDQYLKDSILNPGAKIVKGYAGLAMPPFAGVLDDKQIDAIIEYLKTLK